MRPFTALERLDDDGAVLTNTMSGRAETRRAPTASSWSASASRATGARSCAGAGSVRVIGDALVPRKAAHAIAEGRAAAESIAGARPRAAATPSAPDQAIRTSVLPIVSPASIRDERLGRALEPVDDRLAVAQPPVASQPPTLALHLGHPVHVAAAAEAAQRQVVGGRLEQVARARRAARCLVLRDRPAQRDAAARRSAAERRLEVVAADVVEVDVDPVRARPRAAARRPGRRGS